MRPSCGRRFSAMSSRDMVLMRDTIAACTILGMVWMSCSTPSMRKRIRRPVALGLDVDVARAGVEGVLEHELDRVDDVLVARLDLGLVLHAHELLEVAEVDAGLEVALGALDRLAQAVELGDRAQDVGLGGDHQLDLAPGDAAEGVDALDVVGVGAGDLAACRRPWPAGSSGGAWRTGARSCDSIRSASSDSVSMRTCSRLASAAMARAISSSPTDAARLLEVGEAEARRPGRRRPPSARRSSRS